MKRIKYVSEFATKMTSAEISELSRLSAENNRADQITGMLIASGELFFQLIEGPDAAIDALFARILADDGHKNVTIVGVEQGEISRMCPDWSMNKLDLGRQSSIRLDPLRAILRALVAQSRLAEDLTGALEHAMLRELIAAESDSIADS